MCTFAWATRVPSSAASTPSGQSPFEAMIQRLRRAYGRPKPLPSNDPLQLIYWENAAYLLSDERRQKVFDLLRERWGLEPRQILAAKYSELLEIAKLGGMRPEVRVERWLTIARIALSEFQGDLHKAVKLPLKQARKALQRFPVIGEPGAEKILLFSNSHAVLGLDSNGLRVLVRVGYGRQQKNYSATYRSVQEAITPQLGDKPAPLIQAHQLLRQHGMERCKTSAPICRGCALTDVCGYYQTQSPARKA
jgi:endonuclease III